MRIQGCSVLFVGLLVVANEARADYPGTAAPAPVQGWKAQAPDDATADPAALESPPPSPPPAPRMSAPKHDRQHVSITMSPLHLLLPMFEGQVEVSLIPGLGVAGIFGIGSINSSTVDPAYGDHKFSAYEVGGQVVGYPVREFSSLQVGAEVLWIKVSTDTFDGKEVSAAAGGVAVGPFIGYKLLTREGFTLFVQGGVEVAVIKASASDDTGSAHNEQSSVIPLLNLNIGWSI